MTETKQTWVYNVLRTPEVASGCLRDGAIEVWGENPRNYFVAVGRRERGKFVKVVECGKGKISDRETFGEVVDDELAPFGDAAKSLHVFINGTLYREAKVS